MHSKDVILKAAKSYNDKCAAAAKAITDLSPMAANRASAIVIADRIQRQGDVLNTLASVMRGLRDANVSATERQYFHICEIAIAGAMDEISKKHLAATLKRLNK
jgi:hypothetical protein